MSETTTKALINWSLEQAELCRSDYPRPDLADMHEAIAARLKALEEMRSEVARFQEEMHDDGQCLGVPSMACLDISDRLRAILDAAREVE